MSVSLPDDVKTLSWAAEQLGIGVSTAYRIVGTGQIPGAFRVGGQWRVSVPRFLSDVHGVPSGAPDGRRCSLNQPAPARESSPCRDPDVPGHGHRPAG